MHAVDPRALVIAESGLNDPKVIRPRGRAAGTATPQWADDFHHAVRALVSDEREGYYAEFGEVGAARQGVRPPVRPRRRLLGVPPPALRGARPDRRPEQFVVFDQNHDQVGNRASATGSTQGAAARQFCVLLSPFTPMLFMGEEYGERAPFQFFSDHIDKRIAKATREGRRREFAVFAAFAGEEIPDPQDPATFEASKLTAQGRRAATRSSPRAARGARASCPPGDAEASAFDERAQVAARAPRPVRAADELRPRPDDPGQGPRGRRDDRRRRRFRMVACDWER